MTQKNIVLITIDCLRADHLGCYGYKKNISPFMNSLGKNGLIFSNAYANGPFTIASFPSILASIYPMDYGKMIPFPKIPELLSETLSKHGIFTVGINSNPYLTEYFGYNRGWNEFIDYIKNSNQNIKIDKKNNVSIFIKKMISSKSKLITKNDFIKFFYYYIKYALFENPKRPYVSASKITSDAIKILDKKKSEPFFLWIHYMDAHGPYQTKNHYSNKAIAKAKMNIEKNEFSEEDIYILYKKCYENGIRRIDKNIKILYDHINQNFNDTISIITSDHGQQFFEHGSFGHYAYFYKELIHIPLIINGPGIKNGTRNELVQQIDIPPTILSLLDIKQPKTYKGMDLLGNENHRDYIIVECHHDENYDNMNKIGEIPPYKSYAIRTKKWKCIIGDNRKKLFNLKDDPHERKNIYDDYEELTRYFEMIVKKHSKKQKRGAEIEKMNNNILKLKTTLT